MQDVVIQRPMPVAPVPCIHASASALPPHRYDQRALAQLATRLFSGMEDKHAAVERLFARVGVGTRRLALSAEQYGEIDGLESRSRAFLDAALPLGVRCLRSLFAEAGVSPRDVSLLATTTVTGVSVPSLDARLMNRIAFPSNLKRLPLFGLGCLGGAAGLARVGEYVRAFPDQLAVLLSVELCSLTFQREDVSTANVISAGLFGDGAAAVLVAGSEHPLATARPSRTGAMPSEPPGASPVWVVDSRATLFGHTERVMGWDVIDSGFKVVLDQGVPDLVAREVPAQVDRFLAAHDLTRADISAWVSHPGGPAVMDALERGLGLGSEALAPSRTSLREVGNLSSASVLRLLDEYRKARAPTPGSHGLLLAMGPGFSLELVLLRW